MHAVPSQNTYLTFLSIHTHLKRNIHIPIVQLYLFFPFFGGGKRREGRADVIDRWLSVCGLFFGDGVWCFFGGVRGRIPVRFL